MSVAAELGPRRYCRCGPTTSDSTDLADGTSDSASVAREIQRHAGEDVPLFNEPRPHCPDRRCTGRALVAASQSRLLQHRRNPQLVHPSRRRAHGQRVRGESPTVIARGRPAPSSTAAVEQTPRPEPKSASNPSIRSGHGRGLRHGGSGRSQPDQAAPPPLTISCRMSQCFDMSGTPLVVVDATKPESQNHTANGALRQQRGVRYRDVQDLVRRCRRHGRTACRRLNEP